MAWEKHCTSPQCFSRSFLMYGGGKTLCMSTMFFLFLEERHDVVREKTIQVHGVFKIFNYDVYDKSILRGERTFLYYWPRPSPLWAWLVWLRGYWCVRLGVGLVLATFSCFCFVLPGLMVVGSSLVQLEWRGVDSYLSCYLFGG
jgi:hypothetical protein